MKRTDLIHSPRAALARQFAKYAIVGVSNSALSFVIYALCVQAGVWYLGAAAIAFTAGAVNGYMINRRWTFRAATAEPIAAAKYIFVQLIGMLGNLGLLALLVESAGSSKLLGQALATPVVAVLTFAANRMWTFAPSEREPGGILPEAAR